MKEDILEQIADDYLNLQGYFTLANVRYAPAQTDPEFNPQQDCITSDIDLIGINPLITGPSRVVAVSCKSWQDGFWPRWELGYIAKQKSFAGRKRWRTFRELANDKWARAFRAKIKQLTGQEEFEYWTVCLFVAEQAPDAAAVWTENAAFRKRLTPHLRLVTLHEIFREIYTRMTTTPASSEIGRLIQVMKAAKVKIES